MKKRSMSALRFQKNFWGWLFTLPQLIGILVFSLIPIGAAFYLSFTKYSALDDPVFVGLSNYVSIFQDEAMYKALFNTIYYTVLTVPVGIILSLLLAIALNNIRAKLVYRTIFFMPYVTSSVSIALIWMWIFNGDFGILNQALAWFGINGPNWLTNKHTVMPAIALMSIWWGMGYNMILFLAGLQGIPSVYYEAAEIDGADGFKKFWHITIPLLSPTTFFITIMAIIKSFQVFDQTYIMTEGGPAKASLSLVLYIYQNAFEYFKMGTATTIAMILLVLVIIITAIQFWGSKHWVHYLD